jgi:hypothetical protein
MGKRDAFIEVYGSIGWFVHDTLHAGAGECSYVGRYSIANMNLQLLIAN